MIDGVVMISTANQREFAELVEKKTKEMQSAGIEPEIQYRPVVMKDETEYVLYSAMLIAKLPDTVISLPSEAEISDVLRTIKNIGTPTKEKLLEIAKNAIRNMEVWDEYEHERLLEILGINEEEYTEITGKAYGSGEEDDNEDE